MRAEHALGPSRPSRFGPVRFGPVRFGPFRFRPSRSVRFVTAVLLAALVLAGCSQNADTPTPSPGASTAVRPFTIMTTDKIRTADPAEVTEQGSMILVENVFQRLMTSDPGGTFTKPDLARDCQFSAPTAYTCVLNEGLTFSNGDPITSADVKFSIDRAARLDVAGSSASALDSLRRIETPDAMTVRFVLSRYDRQFSWALASPAASIVDRKVYNPDELQPNDAPIVGSGPFKVTSFTDKKLLLTKFNRYIGRTAGQLTQIQILTEPNSASIEDAMKAHQTDMVWRGLSSAALARLAAQVQASSDRQTAAGFSQHVLPGARVLQLRWNPTSRFRSNAALRKVIAGALQEDRTLDSVVPYGIPDHHTSFPLGGSSKAEITWSNRIPLTLGYDASIPDGSDLANQVRSRLEDTGGMSVRLRPNDGDTDLLLEDRKAPTPTPIAWLQPVLDSPLPGSEAAIDRADSTARTSDDAQVRDAALATLQEQAATDDVVLPMTQGNEVVYTASGVRTTSTTYGPGWQLGLWGLSRAGG